MSFQSNQTTAYNPYIGGWVPHPAQTHDFNQLYQHYYWYLHNYTFENNDDIQIPWVYYNNYGIVTSKVG